MLDRINLESQFRKKVQKTTNTFRGRKSRQSLQSPIIGFQNSLTGIHSSVTKFKQKLES